MVQHSPQTPPFVHAKLGKVKKFVDFFIQGHHLYPFSIDPL